MSGTDPHDLAVRNGIARLTMPPASIASRLTFVTTRTSLLPRRDARDFALIPIFRNGTTLRQIGTTGNFRMARMRDLPIGQIASFHSRSRAMT